MLITNVFKNVLPCLLISTIAALGGCASFSDNAEYVEPVNPSGLVYDCDPACPGIPEGKFPSLSG